ncbi:MAG: cysteine hydrolase [Lachnospiraceae bacterium]|nr:cysteine hydrolase [Lachnospiraceae bacterium]
MSKKLLIVVDMQNDFTTGALRNEDAIAIIPNVVAKVKAALAAGTDVIFTRDTHHDDYMGSEEGRNLPVPHCIEGTSGWELIEELKPLAEPPARIIDKLTFGSSELGRILGSEYADCKDVELIGICTDICVISNALLTKAFLPNAHVTVDASCCAGVTPESHNTALEAMKACHVEVL